MKDTTRGVVPTDVSYKHLWTATFTYNTADLEKWAPLMTGDYYRMEEDVDLSPIVIPAVYFDQTRLEPHSPLSFTPTFADGHFAVEHETLNLIAFGKTRDKLEIDIVEWLEDGWLSYAEADDDQLTPDAAEIGRVYRETFAKVDDAPRQALSKRMEKHRDKIRELARQNQDHNPWADEDDEEEQGVDGVESLGCRSPSVPGGLLTEESLEDRRDRLRKAVEEITNEQDDVLRRLAEDNRSH